MPFTSVVRAIEPGSAAALADIEVGDVIFQIGMTGTTWQGHSAVIDHDLEKSDRARLGIVRGDRRIEVLLQALPKYVAAPSIQASRSRPRARPTCWRAGGSTAPGRRLRS